MTKALAGRPGSRPVPDHQGRRVRGRAALQTTVLDCFFAVPSNRLGEMEEVLIDFGDSGTQVFHMGPGSVAVPGVLAGLEEAHRRFATREWANLVSPALGLARDGFERDEARVILHRILAPILLREEAGRHIYGQPGRVVTEDFCATLERVREVGSGAVPELLPELAEDVLAYRVQSPPPLEIAALGFEIESTPAPSLGGVVVERINRNLPTCHVLLWTSTEKTSPDCVI